MGVKIHLAGKTAWATFKYTISGDIMENNKSRHIDGAGLGTAVLEERQGRWQIVAKSNQAYLGSRFRRQARTVVVGFGSAGTPPWIVLERS